MTRVTDEVQAYRFSITWELDFRGTARTTWTAPADLRCGDLIVLYESKDPGRGAFVAIGRAVTDSVRSYKRVKDRHWAWIDWRAVKKPLDLASARKQATLPSLQGQARIAQEDVDKLANRMTRSDPTARAALARWRAGQGFPRTNEVPIHQLLVASYGDDEHEKHLYEPIEKSLVADGWKPLTKELRAAIKGLRGPLAFDPDADYGLRPDLLLRRSRSKRLIVVEVKRVALPKQGYRHPPDQVMDYSKAVRKALNANGFKDWTVEPLLAAVEFSPVVLEDAGKVRAPAGIKPIVCKQWSHNTLVPPSN